MNRQARKSFWISMGVTLAMLILLIGAVTVDYRGRRLSFGDDTPPLKKISSENGTVTLEVKLFGIETEADITEIDKIWKLILDFSCIPHG